jgi:hypothetical protein
VTFPSRERVILEGSATHWDIVGDRGNVKTHAFCPTCGSPVYLTFAAAPELFTVHAASLDDPSRYEPRRIGCVAMSGIESIRRCSSSTRCRSADLGRAFDRNAPTE